MDYIELDLKITPLEPGRDIVMAQLSEVGFESFVDNDKGLLAYVQKGLFDEKLLKQINIFKQPDFTINYHTKIIEDQNWNEVWEKSFDPINVEGKCYIRAPFHQKEDDIEYDIVIEPKMSFGTGHHETTYLMVKRVLGMDVQNKEILDMGCGTGILAILAKLKKAVHVLAVDVDEWAFHNTIENIERNDNLQIDVQLGGVETISNYQFDIIMANINRNILLQDMRSYAQSLNQKGDLLLSGFFLADKKVLIEEVSKHQLELVYEESNNDWTLLHLVKT